MLTVIPYMETLQTKCAQGRTGVGAARSCVNSMVSGSLSTNLKGNLEKLGGALNSPFSEANRGNVYYFAHGVGLTKSSVV